MKLEDMVDHVNESEKQTAFGEDYTAYEIVRMLSRLGFRDSMKNQIIRTYATHNGEDIYHIRNRYADHLAARGIDPAMSILQADIDLEL